MQQPVGFVDSTKFDYVCKLHKSLYGLKQAARTWYDKLRNCLMELGFKCSVSDNCLFYRFVNDMLTLILVYVDDILVTGDSHTEVLAVIEVLHTKFKLKNLGDVHYFLGIEVTRSGSDYVLSQKKYINELLLKTKMDESNACSTPMVVYPKLSRLDGVVFEDASLYRSVVGSLQYFDSNKTRYCL